MRIYIDKINNEILLLNVIVMRIYIDKSKISHLNNELHRSMPTL